MRGFKVNRRNVLSGEWRDKNMKYTVQLDFFIDEDAIRTDEEVKEVVEEIFDYSNCSASNIKVIDVND